jgi:hypothetical protein
VARLGRARPNKIFISRAPVAAAGSAALGLVTETETSQTVTLLKTETASQVIETESSQTVTVRRIISLGIAIETESSRPVTLLKTAPVNQVIETESAQSVSTSTSAVYPKAVYVVNKEAINRARVLRSRIILPYIDLGPPLIIAAGEHALGQVSEIETALTISPRKTTSINLVIETETARAVTTIKVKSIGLTVETESSRSTTVKKVVTLGLVTETETARTIVTAASGTAPIAQVVETETARSISLRKTETIGLTVETESSRSTTVKKIVTLGLVTETETARTTTPRKTKTLGLTTEIETARQTITKRICVLSQAVEVETALQMIRGGTFRPTIDVVAVALVRVLTSIPASRVDTTLPKETTVWADGFVQAVGISEESGMYVPLHTSMITVSCWATNIGSGKPPWGKANQLAEALKVECLDHSNFPITLDLSPFGSYAPARVHSAYFVNEPHRIPSDEGSYARYDGDLQVHWTPL